MSKLISGYYFPPMHVGIAKTEDQPLAFLLYCLQKKKMPK